MLKFTLTKQFPFIVTALMTAGCSAPPERHVHDIEIPLPSEWSASVDTDHLPLQNWIESFNDLALLGLVKQALESNIDLKLAAARVHSAVAQVQIDGAELWPQLSFAPGYQHTQVRSAGFGTARFSVFEALFGFDWEVDIWGRLRAFREAANLEASAAHADFQAARLSLAARVAQHYFALLEADLQIQVAEQSVSDRGTIASLVQGRFERGLVRGLDLRLALTDLANAKSRLAQTKNQAQLITRQLEILLGRYPAGTLKEIGDAARNRDSLPVWLVLPELTPALPAGLPSDLLARRPDLIAAFTRLRAADARLTSVQKLLLPRIALTAAGGTRDRALTDLIDPRSMVWNLFTGAIQPLFTGGRIHGEIQLSQVHVTEAFHHYQKAALNAFQEVEQALATEEWLREQEKALHEAVLQTEASQEMALYSYRHGFIQILTLLDSYRSTLDAQSAYLTIQRQLLNNRINLYLALGGDF